MNKTVKKIDLYYNQDQFTIMGSEIKFQKISNKIVLIQKYNNFILNNIDESIAINRIEKFFRRYQLLVSNNFDDYLIGKKNKINKILKLYYFGLEFKYSN